MINSNITTCRPNSYVQKIINSRTFVQKPESLRWYCSVAGYGEVDFCLIRWARKDDLIFTGRTEKLGRIKAVRYPDPAWLLPK